MRDPPCRILLNCNIPWTFKSRCLSLLMSLDFINYSNPYLSCSFSHYRSDYSALHLPTNKAPQTGQKHYLMHVWLNREFNQGYLQEQAWGICCRNMSNWTSVASSQGWFSMTENILQASPQKRLLCLHNCFFFF